MKKIFTRFANCKKSAIAFLTLLFCLMMKSEVGLSQVVTQTFSNAGTYTFTVPTGVKLVYKLKRGEVVQEEVLGMAVAGAVHTQEIFLCL